jgi:uncharacterized protein YwqG/Lon protease-like protein
MMVETAAPIILPGERRTLPILPLRDMVVFPGMTVPLFVGRERSIRAIEAAAASDMLILFLAQKTDEDAPTNDGFFGVGTVGRLLQRRELPDGTVKVLVECVERAAVLNYTERPEYHEANIVVIESEAPPTHALADSLIAKFQEFVKVEKTVLPGVVDAVRRAGDVGRMADTVASHIAAKVAEKQAILETTSVAERIGTIVSLMDKRIASRGPRSGVGDEMKKPTPAIWFRRQAGKASSSKLGGLPSMPSDLEWPKQHQSGAPLHFLAQVDLSHLPATPLEDVPGAPRLPKSGLLFFFADMEEEMVWDDNGGPLANTRVIFASHAGPERSPPDGLPSIGHGFGEMTSAYGSGKAVFDQAALIPNVIGTFLNGEPLIPEAVAAAAAKDLDPPGQPLHQMFGYGADIQGTAGEAHSDGLILLLQIDSDRAVDKEFMFCDMGMVQFWIKPADLAAGRFDKAWATTEGG